MAETIAEVAKQMGMVMNQPPQQGGGQPGAIASSAQTWGAGDYDPYADLMTGGQT